MNPMDTLLFETERLIARRWELADADAAFAVYGDPDVARYIGGRVEISVSHQRATIATILARQRQHNERLGSWPLIAIESGAMIGTILLKPLPDERGLPSHDIEIGWHLARRAWGQGYATEAGRACLHYAFHTLGLRLVHAVVEPPNAPSKAVALRIGMTHHGLTRRYYNGKPLDYFTISAPAEAGPDSA